VPFQFDAGKIRRVQKIFRAKIEIEAIGHASDFANDGHRRIAPNANEKFVRNEVEIKSANGKLGDFARPLFSILRSYMLRKN
jgi:hypothetical protein